MEQNTQLQLAAEFMHYTNKNIFLTGKAGTGKTTFLHNLKKTLHKRMAIVAPTGVAAINAGGVTIHSFFQLPFGPHIPESFMATASVHKFSKERINLIKSLDLLVIDEISMVRADMLDGIDEVLRKYKDRNRPFGGIQLLMIGDLHQLSPVIKDEEWGMLKAYYDTIYFFSSHALRKTSPVRIELTHIYRQSDTTFIDLLNSVRENKLDTRTLEILNQRYIPNFKPADDEGYITLTTHNASAQNINSERLQELDTKTKTFKAEVSGDFPAMSYPTEQNLEIKVGAQVMFVKNDISREKLFYNGKIGQISRMTSEAIYVKCKGEYGEIEVERAEWRNVKYALNEQTKEIEEQIIGSFVQYPLKLAWAITIHKSQGLTFEKAIIDANASFAHGQVYVALSRCKSFEGMVLSTKIGSSSVKTDGTVAAYSRDASNNPPDNRQLLDAKFDFQRSLLFELFDFGETKRAFFLLNRVLEENATIMNPAILDAVRQTRDTFERDIFIVAEKFRNQLNQLMAEVALPEENDAVKERFGKAINYFSEKINSFLEPETSGLDIETDNTAVKKVALQALEVLQKSVFVKSACVKVSQEGFSTNAYLRAKANADIDFKAKKDAGPVKKEVTAPKNMQHSKLYATLKSWRKDVAAENNVLDYMVIPMKTLLEISETLPTTSDQLAHIKGIGKAKVNRYGSSLIGIVKNYCLENDVEIPEINEAAHSDLGLKTKKEKSDTKRISLELFLEGKTIDEVALERGLTPATVETHLIHFIETEELDIYKLYAPDKITAITAYLTANRQATLGEAKNALGDNYSYPEIRACLKYLRTTDL
ncbi:helix-turn-helix domain-containing protein [Dyadobacter sp. CY312]|uniref:helix-turn-helix domain-containing protein n=1 Tax=Dyadobacter sp. CY312 TaxID=2907303 RepID=UPI00210745DC|nr:helix-turn-helix domain-containing protein [Dyadobacter sp. CY312]